MSHYRLLRDNKESGPFSEEEMIAKGFKPYDLIWVEGKSAGWRYPSEIPAFSQFAPVVEEQPYDRFYKKQTPQKFFFEEDKIQQLQKVSDAPVATAQSASVIAKEISREPVPVVQPVIAAAQVPLPAYDPAPSPARHIHVTLPSGNTLNLTTIVNKAAAKDAGATVVNAPVVAPVPPGTELVRPVVTTSAMPENKQEAAPVFAAAYTAGKENNDTIFATPLPANTFSMPDGFSWGLAAACFIGIATLVGLGIMIGLSISRDKHDLAFNEAIRSRSVKSQVVKANSNPAGLSGESVPATVVKEFVQPLTTGGEKELVQNAVVKTNLPLNNAPKETKKITEAPILPAQAGTSAEKSNEGPAISHSKPAAAVANVSKDLLLTPNDFKTGPFGGISGLKYTLVNGSKLPLESVEVEIDYIQANNKIYKTEKLLFRDLNAGAQSTMDAPSSSRGVKTSIRITRINPKEAPLSNTTAKS